MNDKNGTISTQRYVNLLTDAGFKALFGDENNKEVVKTIINTLLPPDKLIKEIIKYLPTELRGSFSKKRKTCYLDFLCEDELGTKFIVEMQQYRDKHWAKRCVSYAARVYDKENKVGTNYDVPPVYLIGIMAVEVNHTDTEYWREHFISEYTFRERTTHDLLGETIFIIFAELANFNKSEGECKTDLDKVLYLLKNLGKIQEQPQGFEQKKFTDIIDACEIAGFDDSKLKKYNMDIKDADVIKSIAETAREDSFAEGEARGKAEGKAEEKQSIALKLMKIGLPLDQISKATGLSIEEVKALK